MTDLSAFIDDDVQEENFTVPWPKDLPKPGLHHDVSFDDYLKWPAISQSTLKVGREISWLHCKTILDGKMPERNSDALNFGKAIHMYLLEPDRFGKSFSISTPCCAEISSGTNKGKACGNKGTHKGQSGKWYCGLHAKSREAVKVPSYLTEGELKRIKTMSDRIKGTICEKIMRQRGGAEVSATAHLDGFPIKIRLDYFAEKTPKNPSVIIDLKKVQAGYTTRYDLLKKIRDYGYDFQAACYVKVVQELTGETPAYFWAFYEDGEPHELIFRQASSEMLRVGYVKFDDAWRSYRHNVQHNFWPGCDHYVPEQLDPEDWEIRNTLGAV